ncbi:hypothetical protein [Rhodoferax fermentans]|uniref:Uncharacterized protein n=1 Tax=Rhodoferax fermentans TaxID=28066 RepID=A0A1T1APG0_RHOFE|nr:hypothetical protein [Rhodoferax fermentans]MBK1683416.1 hypothetical protein [Rhodoferax fermentans]OOV05838.1 hypothetical protein RF819_03140 [Rhodoferax fermentans]
MTAAALQDTIKARRVTGGAVVTVVRADGRTHRHQVSLRRYRALRGALTVHDGLAGGNFTHNGFECRLRDVAGMAASLRWVKRNAPRLLRGNGRAA